MPLRTVYNVKKTTDMGNTEQRRRQQEDNRDFKNSLKAQTAKDTRTFRCTIATELKVDLDPQKAVHDSLGHKSYTVRWL